MLNAYETLLMRSNLDWTSFLLFGVENSKISLSSFFAELNKVHCDLKASKLNCVMTEHELVTVQGYTTLTTNIKSLSHLMKAFSYINLMGTLYFNCLAWSLLKYSVFLL